MAERDDYPYLLPEHARVLAAAQAPAGCYWPAVIDDFARFGWVHLGCNAHEGLTDWYWLHAEGGVLVVRVAADLTVAGMAALEGEEARRVARAAPGWAEVAGG